MSESELDRLRKKVENFPSASLLTQLAELSRSQSLFDEAEKWALRCITQFPRHGQAYIVLAGLQERTGQVDAAIATLTSAVAKDPRMVSAFRLLAELQVRMGRRREAMAVLQNALLKCDDAGLRKQLADLSNATTEALRRRKPVTAQFTSRSALIPKSAPPAGVATPFSSQPTSLSSNQYGTPAPTSKGTAIDLLLAENGVRGMVVVDASGRVVTSKRMTAGQDDVLAALAAEVTNGGRMALAATAAGAVSSWGAALAKGQVLVFTSAAKFSVVILADLGVRSGMIELRAKAVLTDMGAA